MLTPLHYYPDLSETNILQPLFKNWVSRRYHPQGAPVAISGAPSWLLEAPNPLVKQSFDAYGYSFEVDVLWRFPHERRVVELKNASKYEPLALAEALHHAHLVELCDLDGTGPVMPTVVAHYSPWSRAAIKYMADHGFDTTHLECLEFDHLEDDAKQQYLWLDDPFAPWTSVEGVPVELPPEVTDGWPCWYRIDRTGSWIGTLEPVEGGRPLFMTVPFKMASPVEGRPGELLLWQGTPPPRGTDKRHKWSERVERFTP